MSRAHQLAELALLRASVLPPAESLEFLDDGAQWDGALRAHAGLSPPLAGIGAPAPTGAARVAVRVAGAPVWFEAALPPAYAGAVTAEDGWPAVRAHGADAPLGRADAAHWEDIVHTRQAAVAASACEFPLFELFAAYLLPLLHDLPLPASAAADPPHAPRAASPEAVHHALLTSHHLKAPSKRRALAAWAAQHALCGFAKLGHPGVIYAAGPAAGLAAFVGDVKALQWLALRVRFVEPLPEELHMDDPSWTELEKVGEVVEWMRARGRERFIVEMGIGSAGAK